MPTTVAVTMAMTSTLMITGCDKHMTLILRAQCTMQTVLKYVHHSLEICTVPNVYTQRF